MQNNSGTNSAARLLIRHTASAKLYAR